MNSFNTMSGGFFRVEENHMEIDHQQVWPYNVQNENFAYSPDFAGATVASSQNNLYNVQRSTSPDPFREGATEADWDAFLFGSSHTAQDTPISAFSTSFVEPTVSEPIKHVAQITFVPSAEGLRPVVSRKRHRTAFTTEQVAALEEFFNTKPYITREERSVLSQRLAVGEQNIKVWFQNRRLKKKKDLEEQLEEAQLNAEHTTMFPHTEVLVQQADQNGIVTMDEQSIEEFRSAIQACLPIDLETLIGDVSKLVETEESSTSSFDSVHEPISPPEVDATSELSNLQQWWSSEVIDPNHSLQCLLDIHSSNI